MLAALGIPRPLGTLEVRANSGRALGSGAEEVDLAVQSDEISWL